MRRLSSLVAHRDTPVAPSVFQNNRYSYDLVGNILSVENAISQPPSAISSLGGSSKYTYEYDELNRLIKAKGTFEGTSNKADYELNMQYNRLNGIVQKALKYTLNGQDKGYTLNYEYNDKKHPHAPSSISGIAPFGGQGAGKPRNYTYDGNGNPTYYDEFKGFRSMVWDEENRLRGINDNGRLHLYTYDHTGERALKSSAESSMAVINGLASAVITHTEDYTAYVSPYFVVQKGKFTKHYFEGATRVVSKLGEGTFSHKNTGIMAGGLDYLKRTQKEQEARDRYIKGLNVPPGPPTQHGIYTTPEWTGQPYPSIDWEAISQNQEPPAGWPRYPRFNEPDDVPGPPVQFGEPLTNTNARAGFNFIPNGVEEKNIYYYHPDHLGSSSYITDKNGEVIQHTEYMAFGEVLVDEHTTKNITTAGGTTIFANCSECLNPGTLYQNPTPLLSFLKLSYPGGNNPRTYGKKGKTDYSYEYVPELLSEYPAIGHDRRYDNLQIKGASGLFFDTRAIGADWKFVGEQMAIAYNPLNGASIKDRAVAYSTGLGLGLAATPKTILTILSNPTPQGIGKIIRDYNKSNKGVTNQPIKR